MAPRVSTLAVIVLLVLSAGQANASPIMDFVDGSAFTSGLNQTAGWAFDVTSPIQVDGLGFWDEGADGLSGAHDVGLWSWDGSTAILLASTTVDNGDGPVASTSSDGQWFFGDITSLVLAPGGYLIGGVFVPDDPDQARALATITTFPSITYLGSRGTLELGSPLLVPPTLIGSPSDGLFGPNIRLTPVPEPASLLLLATGLIGAGLRRYGRSR